MKIFFTTVVAGLLLVAGVNYSVDSGHAWHTLPFDAVLDSWPKNKIWATGDDFDDRKFRLAQLKRAPRPEILVLGSSRGMLASAGMFAPGRTFFNAGVAGASIEDYVWIWQTLKEMGKVPDRVVLFADPWVFNRNSSQIRWMSNFGIYQRFFVKSGGHGAARVYIRVAKESWRIFYNNLCELLSWKQLTASVHRLRAGPRSPSLLPASFEPETTGLRGWRADGSYVYSAADGALKDLETIRADAAQFASGDVYSLSRYQSDGNAETTLRLLADDLAASGSKLMVISPPYHRVVLDKLSGRPEYSEIPASFSSKLAELSASGTRFRFCDAIEPETSGCDEREFKDGMHPIASCQAKVVSRCLGLFPEWKELGAAPSAPYLLK